MNINIDLPEVDEDTKAKMEVRAKEWEQINIDANLGDRFARLLLFQELHAPLVIIDHAKQLVAQALYCHNVRRKENKEDEDDEGAEEDVSEEDEGKPGE